MKFMMMTRPQFKKKPLWVVQVGKPKVKRPLSYKNNLNNLWEFGQHADAPSINPYGKASEDKVLEMAENDPKPSMRERAMRKRRVRLEVKKRHALEAHELQRMARENALTAMKTLIEISENDRAPESTRIAASQAILDRGYGKSSQTSITANVTNHAKASEITADELDTRVRQALQRAEDLTNRTRKAPEGQKRSSDLHKLN